MAGLLDWDVAIYCVNEAGRLRGCLASVAAALAGSAARISVILNGSTDESITIAREAAGSGAPVAIFSIATADKSNAMNQFYYNICAPARAYAGVDGYVEVGPESFRAMQAHLQNNPHALAVTGVALNGRTMKLATEPTLRKGGQLHGPLHALRPEFLDRMVARGIRQPFGLYCGDGLLCSMAAHDLDPIGTRWDDTRVQGVAEATYEIPALSLFKPRDLQRQYRREIRQMRGRIENAAIKSIIYTGGYEALPASSFEMARMYLAAHKLPPAPVSRRLFQLLAVRSVDRGGMPAPERLLARAV